MQAFWIVWIIFVVGMLENVFSLRITRLEYVAKSRVRSGFNQGLAKDFQSFALTASSADSSFDVVVPALGRTLMCRLHELST